MMSFSLLFYLNLQRVYIIDGLVCHSMSGSLLVIYYNVHVVFSFCLPPLSLQMSDCQHPSWWADMEIETLSYLVNQRVNQGWPILEISTFCWQSLELWCNTWVLVFGLFLNRDPSLLTLPQLAWGIDMYKSHNHPSLMKIKSQFSVSVRSWDCPWVP